MCDVVTVLTSFCVCLYGRRSANNCILEALEADRHG
jgi:predicted site-specific integrase-resolvase